MRAESRATPSGCIILRLPLLGEPLGEVQQRFPTPPGKAGIGRDCLLCGLGGRRRHRVALQAHFRGRRHLCGHHQLPKFQVKGRRNAPQIRDGRIETFKPATQENGVYAAGAAEGCWVQLPVLLDEAGRAHRRREELGKGERFPIVHVRHAGSLSDMHVRSVAIQIAPPAG